MRRIPISILTLMTCFFFCIAQAQGAKAPPGIGDGFPDIGLAAPKEGTDKDYLGLSGGGSFKIPQIRTRVVIIEIFSMYCPFCQREAPNVNKLYEAIETNSALKGKIKIIGIGAGNSVYEVGLFKKKYNISFPLIPDADFAAYDQIGEVRTPYFIAVQVDSDGTSRVIYSKLGAIGNVAPFLQLILQSSGLK